MAVCTSPLDPDYLCFLPLQSVCCMEKVELPVMLVAWSSVASACPAGFLHLQTNTSLCSSRWERSCCSPHLAAWVCPNSAPVVDVGEALLLSPFFSYIFYEMGLSQKLDSLYSPDHRFKCPWENLVIYSFVLHTLCLSRSPLRAWLCSGGGLSLETSPCWILRLQQIGCYTEKCLSPGRCSERVRAV